MKIFELRWNKQDEKEWIAANTNIEALRYYFSTTSIDWFDLDDEDEIIEVPESDWPNLSVTNTDFDSSDKDDWKVKTFEEYMKECKSPVIIAGTMYN